MTVTRWTSPTSRRGPANDGLVVAFEPAGTARSTQNWPPSFAMVAADTVVEKTPAAFGISPGLRTSAIVPSQRRSTLSDLPLLVPVTARPEGPVAGYVM